MKIEHNSNVNQDIKRMFVDREVIACASTLVYELAQKADEFRDYSEDLYGAFQGLPDYEEAAIQNGWVKLTQNDETVFYNKEKETYVNVETWEELCDDQGIDAYEYAPEIFEHWIITDWFASRLEEHGEKVLRDFFGFTIWCRSTTGQAILLDGVISEICEEMEILQGQKNDWSK